LGFVFWVRSATLAGMATILNFEDIEAWQSARKLRRAVYQLTRVRPFAADFALVDQIRRAAISGGSNIAEGFERGGTREFVQFLSYAKGSVAEIKDQLYCALDENYLTQKQFDETYSLADSSSRLIGGFMSYLRTTGLTGHKFDSTTAGRDSERSSQNSKPASS
jgi:four helix bundle protein